MISESVYKNLVNNVYIHSNTDNFVGINQYFMEFKRSETVKNELDIAKQSLDKIIKSVTDQCNDFYNDVGILGRDSFDFSKGDFSLMGAKSFNQQYLGVKNKERLLKGGNENFSKAFLTIFDSVEFKNLFYKKINEKFPLSVNTDEDLSFIDDYNSLNKKTMTKFIKKIDIGAEEITVDMVTSAINSLFNNQQIGKSGKRTGYRIRSNVANKIGFKNNSGGLSTNNALFKGLENEIKDLSLNKTKDVEKMRNLLIKKYIKKPIVSPTEITDILWNTLIECGIKEYITDIYNYKESFKKHFINALKRYEESNVNINIINNTSSYSGFILEEGATFSIQQNLKDLEVKIRVIGQDLETKTFKNSSEQWEQKVESGTDIIVTGKSGKEYKIQAKNFFSQSDYSPIYLQSQIKVDTYANTVLEKEEAKELEYMVFNKAYLSAQGKDSQGNTKLYKNQDTINKYISFFLYQTLAYLVAGKVKQNIKNENFQYSDNIFFIYKGQYLIPVSLFLYTAYKLILELQGQNNNLDKIPSFGSLVYRQELVGYKPTGREATEIRNRKLNVVKGYKDSNYYKYPPKMVEIGKEVGQKYKEKASFGKLTFNTTIKKLEEILK